jgi:hypothetical protein
MQYLIVVGALMEGKFLMDMRIMLMVSDGKIKQVEINFYMAPYNQKL